MLNDVRWTHVFKDSTKQRTSRILERYRNIDIKVWRDGAEVYNREKARWQ